MIGQEYFLSRVRGGKATQVRGDDSMCQYACIDDNVCTGK